MPLPAKTTNVSGSNIIAISVDSADPQSAQNYLNKIGQAIISEHSKIAAAKRENLDNLINSLQENIKKIEITRPIYLTPIALRNNILLSAILKTASPI